MAEARNEAEQIAKYDRNFSMDEGLIVHLPCPGCGEADFLVTSLGDVCSKYNQICKHCTRGFSIIWSEEKFEPEIIKTSGPPLAPWVDLPEQH